MKLTYDDIKKINFDKISSEEELKKVLQITDEEFDELIRNGYDSTDTDTPEDLRDYRIVIYTADDVRITFDLTYSLDDNSLNNVKAYFQE